VPVLRHENAMYGSFQMFQCVTGTLGIDGF
jgi:hypothetical protein